MTDDPRPTVWVLTDGKAGDEQPLIGVCEALGAEPQLRRVSPRPIFTLLMPSGPIDPREAPGKPGSPLAPPFPDICLATGRRAVAYLRALKKASPATLTVFFKNPRTARNGADLIVAQKHDRLTGANVLTVATMPNRIDPGALDALRREPPAALAGLAHPRLAVLIGGNSRHHTFTPGDIERLAGGLRARQAEGASLMITASRRTPPVLKQTLEALAALPGVTVWNGSGANPLLAYLALADEVVVTADSTNMLGEAASTGRPLQVFHPSGGHPKIDRLVTALSQIAHVGRFPEAPASGTYPPVNSTREIADAILRLRLERTRQA
ncbi:mitochondrial fission ELM1 family protein [Rhizobiaceae bacterium BDR2-2]|uniref:Mitochondrial fission ELM1 family protein n=1 Tax=Ectorhizobium quercum TaxID=2965071 RepID=A0AAE3STU7_9HYPH|nr:mitochondrial fission ELM1 family protein [Ectorhizobium quercum]MCX8996545.1 mitochondrial fission ELM1 family protein [Ectorhizobium quercum]